MMDDPLQEFFVWSCVGLLPGCVHKDMCTYIEAFKLHMLLYPILGLKTRHV